MPLASARPVISLAPHGHDSLAMKSATIVAGYRLIPWCFPGIDVEYC